ncbi:7TM diverse intracellular signaling domain-containing protein [Sulfurospirillum arcachonense]|uniref:7TM diverse intracellular signaling domain-containing protein n=1 Tax=Sulfurospirillum arcachonense TaxID=57666 RepID=UPI000468F38A|nr:7TM diverse intracellular signaling domain-containing protein [Sulfurospirillum arcachonense]
MIKIFVRLFFIVAFVSSFSFCKIIVDENMEQLENFSLPYYYDETRSLNIEQIVKIDLMNEVSSQFAFGYTEGNSWFKFEIENRSKNDEVILFMNEPFFEEVNLFEKKNGIWIKRKNGLSVSLEKRDMKDISPVFFIRIEPNSTKTFYIQTFAKFAQFGEFKIYTKKESVNEYRLLVTALYTLLLGSFIFIIIFNLFIYYTMRDRIYLYYVMYIFFTTIFVLAFSGLDLYLGLLPFHYELHLSIPLLIIFLIIFSFRFLETKKYLKHTYVFLKAIIWIYIILTVLSLIQFNPWYQIITALASITYVTLLYMAIRIWYLGYIKAKYYLIAMAIYTFTIAIMSFMINGWIENNDITRYAFLVGLFIETSLFCLILANRFNEAKNELLEIKNKNEKFLENEVEQRTDEITSLLGEKELLLKEVCHRVKNNFQVVISMLSLEAYNYKDEKQRSSFLQLINRIKSMSMVHQFLYDSNKLSEIQSEEYLLKIIQEVKKVYEKRTINIENKIDSIILSVSDAMVLGVIINEVLNNSIKHHNADICNIRVELVKKENIISLTIQDDGVGFIPNQKSKTIGLGLSLIEQFSQKLKASNLEFFSNHGTMVKLSFEV